MKQFFSRYWRYVLPSFIVLAALGYWLWAWSQSTANLNRHYSLSDFPGVKGEEQYVPYVDKINQHYAALRAGVKEQNARFEIWNDIGIRKLALKDYKGAEIAWKEAMKVNPKNPLASANLANLYKSFLPNYPEAERMYLLAISQNSTAEPYYPDYEALADLYQNYWKEKAFKVEPLMTSGLAKAFGADVKLQFNLFLAGYFKASDPVKYQQYEAAVLKLDPSRANQQ